MAWGSTEGSHVFRAWVALTMLSNSATGYGGIEAAADTVKCALFGNLTTPDRNAAVGSTGFNTGTWTTTNEIVGAGWPTTGLVLASQDVNQGTANTFYFDAADRATTATSTLTAVHGCFNYDDTITAGTVADQGICFNYFGGPQSVTAGTFTIQFAAPPAAIFSGTV